MGSNVEGRCESRVLLPSSLRCEHISRFTCKVATLAACNFFWFGGFMGSAISSSDFDTMLSRPLNSKDQPIDLKFFPCDFGTIYPRAALLSIHVWKDLSCCHFLWFYCAPSSLNAHLQDNCLFIVLGRLSNVAPSLCLRSFGHEHTLICFTFLTVNSNSQSLSQSLGKKQKSLNKEI